MFCCYCVYEREIRGPVFRVGLPLPLEILGIQDQTRVTQLVRQMFAFLPVRRHVWESHLGKRYPKIWVSATIYSRCHVYKQKVCMQEKPGIQILACLTCSKPGFHPQHYKEEREAGGGKKIQCYPGIRNKSQWFFRIIYFILCVSVFAFMCACPPRTYLVPAEARRGHPVLQNWSYWWTYRGCKLNAGPL